MLLFPEELDFSAVSLCKKAGKLFVVSSADVSVERVRRTCRASFFSPCVMR
jgi:hypothetical protein